MNTTCIDEIVALEWEMFDRVCNCGGRAPCQDDREPFFIMRSIQFGVWSQQARESYLRDLQEAKHTR